MNWRAALSFFKSDPQWKRKLLIGGALFFPLPPLGWMMALGFRSLTGPRLVEGADPVLPEWRGNMLLIFQRGMKAIFVILCHFTPFLALFWIFGLQSLSDIGEHWREVGYFFGAIALFPPLFLPTLPALYATFSWLSFSVAELAVLAALFVGAFFILPASFVQVGLYGRYRAAFRARSAWRFALLHWRVYLEAWIISLIASGIAVLSGPLMPWGLFWSYLVILHVFLEALVTTNTIDVRNRFANSLTLQPPAAS